MSDKIPPAFMAMPRDCGRGAQPVFGGVRCVDTVICHFYCTKTCQAYSDHVEALEAEKKKRKKDALRVLERKPRRQALETAKTI